MHPTSLQHYSTPIVYNRNEAPHEYLSCSLILHRWGAACGESKRFTEAAILATKEAAGAISIKASEERVQIISAGAAKAQDSQPKSSSEETLGAISIKASKERKRRAKSANHFCGCGGSTRFTTNEQLEAAEPSLLWQAKSASEEQRRQFSLTEIPKIL